MGSPIINITFANILSLAQVAQREKQKEREIQRERDREFCTRFNILTCVIHNIFGKNGQREKERERKKEREKERERERERQRETDKKRDLEYWVTLPISAKYPQILK